MAPLHTSSAVTACPTRGLSKRGDAADKAAATKLADCLGGWCLLATPCLLHVRQPDLGCRCCRHHCLVKHTLISS